MNVVTLPCVVELSHGSCSILISKMFADIRYILLIYVYRYARNMYTHTHSKDTTWPTVQNSGAQPISEILHIENRIVCYILRNVSYQFKIWASVVSPIETGEMYVKCVFLHKLVLPKYHPSWLNELTLKWNIFSFIKILIIFSAVSISLLTFNGYKYW